MITKQTLKPGGRGIKKLTEHFGDRLVCVRYRQDPETGKRFKTAEIIVILIAAAGYGLLRLTLQPYIFEIHTKFLFNQLEEILKNEETSLTSNEAFFQIVEKSNIDWNSCKMEQQTIFDSWDEPIIIQTETKEWLFHSSGANRLMGDSDDITKKVKRTNQSR